MSLTAKELGQILADKYENAQPKQLVVTIHLFGIQYHQEIRRAGIKEVLEAAGMSKVQAELNKGVNLGEHVIPKHPWK
jgi:hypothetical protein